jgi:hypothetical protein
MPAVESGVKKNKFMGALIGAIIGLGSGLIAMAIISRDR